MIVVRCQSCQGQSRVGPDAVGVLVVCPRCRETFLAEAEPDAPPPPAPPSFVRPRPRAVPVAPPVRAKAVAETTHEPEEHSGLPASVLVGLALLPFLIPLLWVLAPAVAGQNAALSIAAPTALAIAASALCLAVVYTVDWSPTTRVKGVLTLVGLSYFAAVSLFFMKKESLDRVKRFFGVAEWNTVQHKEGRYRVEMTGKVGPLQPIGAAPWQPTGHESRQRFFGGGEYVFRVGFKADPQEEVADDVWFDVVKSAFSVPGFKQFGDEKAVSLQNKWPGREWVFQRESDGMARIVRVFRAAGRLYYLSVEGPLTDDDNDVEKFFESFQLLIDE